MIRIFGARLPDQLGPLRGGTLALGGAALSMVVIAAWPSEAGLVVGTAIFAFGMSMMYTDCMTLALVGVDESQRAAVVGTVSTFFDLSQGLGALHRGRGGRRHQLPGRLHRRRRVRARRPRPALERRRPRACVSSTRCALDAASGPACRSPSRSPGP